MNIYIASSWRNPYQPQVVTDLQDLGYEVYDFRNPPNEYGGFSWAEIDPNWQLWTPSQYRQALTHPRARDGFRSDMEALYAADAVILVNPCGRSAHLEAGWAAGDGKPTLLYLPPGTYNEPELMYSMGGVAITWSEVVRWLLSADTLTT